MEKRAIITVSGLVQGIGFRPFVYRLAAKRGLKGHVLNLGDAGVRIDVAGDERSLELFLSDLKAKRPPLAVYTSIDVRWLGYSDQFTDFRIIESDGRGLGGSFSLIPPDISICDECVRDLFDENDRHHLYPFTCCAICGPRFTTIRDLPYDRERTTMDEFTLCPYCAREFNDATDRRFYAQTLCCPLCGPRIDLYDNDGKPMVVKSPISAATRLLEEGFIVAIKGVGGIHLASRTMEDGAVLRLRNRRRKPFKPFAIMSPDVETVRKFAVVSRTEERLLVSYARPIVTLKKKDPFPLSDQIAPGLHTVGVMLPYSGIHYLLFRGSKEPAFVMTSANLPSEPMVVSNEEALKRLTGIADYFLLHDREIWARCDDSVVKVIDDAPSFLRRSRGYSPLPINLPFQTDNTVVAVGPELSSTVAVLREGACYLSQHIGDVDNLETLVSLSRATEHLMKLLRVSHVDAVACDLHPLFASRRVGADLKERYGCPLVEVQHHHAHLAKLMVENGVSAEEKVVGIVCDGVGYGSDGRPWGGEVLVADYQDFERVGHLEPQPMPGGDVCSYWFGRMLQGALHGKMPDDELRRLLIDRCVRGFARGSREVDVVFKQLKRRIKTPVTTSTGRLLDAASCLLGICYRRTYEGEGPMRLEALASEGDPSDVELPVIIEKTSGKLVLKTSPMLLKTWDMLKSGQRREDLAAAVQKTLAEGLAQVATRIADDRGLSKIGFTGGVAYNEAMTRYIRSYVESRNRRFLRHRMVPCGDGGISLGQAAVVAAMTKG